MGLSPESVHIEGYPGSRFHEGASNLDDIERYGQNLAADIFNSRYALVQGWRCTNGIIAVTRALAEPGDTILGLSCSSGGYYATGTRGAHILSDLYRVETYSVCRNTHFLDYDDILETAKKCRPKILFCGDTSYSRAWDWRKMRAIADATGAYMVADISQIAGLIAAGVLDNPAPIADATVFATYKTLRGPKGCIILANEESTLKKIKRAIYPRLQGSVSSSQLVGISACLEEALSEDFKKYSRDVAGNAAFLAAQIQAEGLRVVTGGTVNHSLTVIVPRSAETNADLICKALASRGVLTNKTPIPYDTRAINLCSGVRLGTSHITNDDVTKNELTDVARVISHVMRDTGRQSRPAIDAEEVAV